MAFRGSLAIVALAAAVPALSQDLGTLSIEDLMELKVSTASRRAEAFLDVPAAIYVLTKEDIIRSGAKTIPEMLRLVPGVQVGIIDGNKFRVSIRGFGGRYSNKLQVLIDGRSIYSPLHSGVFWELNLVSPSEIERIEVVRGPGGALWGANAVNGVINVITKEPDGTEGGEVAVGKGTYATEDLEAGYGGALGDDTFYRVYARYLKFADLEQPSGGKSDDGWQTLHGAARGVWKSGEKDKFDVTFRAQTASMNEITGSPTFTAPYFSFESKSRTASDLSLVGVWSHQHSATDLSEATLSLTKDDYSVLDASFHSTVLDAGYQRTMEWSKDRRLVWGASARYYKDATQTGGQEYLDPASGSKLTYGAFGQYEQALAPKLKASLGLTAEHNEYTGFEFQPSARLMWSKSEKESYWASVSRAVKTPSRSDEDFHALIAVMPGMTVPTSLEYLGSDDYKSEELTAFEVGARLRPSEDLYLDLTAYYNMYRRLRSWNEGTPSMSMDPVPHAVMSYYQGNRLSGATGGLEAAFTYQPSTTWRLDGSLTTFSDRFWFPGVEDNRGLEGPERGGSTPRIQASLRTTHQFGKGLSFNMSWLHVGEIMSEGQPSFNRFDAYLSWEMNDRMNLSVAGTDLFGKSRVEMMRMIHEVPSQTEPTLSIQFRMKF